MDRRGDGGMTKITRAKAIRLKCLDCSNYQYQEVRLCPVTDCPLWPYWYGRGYEDPIEEGRGLGEGSDSETKSG
jgi:hypothetical protein